MKDSGCNRDGAAIKIFCKRLSQRPEKIKLLLVLCDGKPNDTDYKGEKAEEDIRSILRSIVPGSRPSDVRSMKTEM